MIPLRLRGRVAYHPNWSDKQSFRRLPALHQPLALSPIFSPSVGPSILPRLSAPVGRGSSSPFPRCVRVYAAASLSPLIPTSGVDLPCSLGRPLLPLGVNGQRHLVRCVLHARDQFQVVGGCSAMPRCVYGSSVVSRCVDEGMSCKFGIFPSRGLHVVAMSSPRLAPKKKKAVAQAVVSTSESTSDPKKDFVFNIFNNCGDKDFEVDKNDEVYPDWLWDLERKRKSYGQLSLTFVYGQGIEAASLDEYRHFRRGHRLQQIRINNVRLKKSKRSSVPPRFWDV
eukprot:GHVT01009763.1.p1 GENE.GHVT01009763.1~~GHVT01009763.1.p1  ORF type:complete len:282 (-),score=35.93 GHVT01009763.1:180-1025(-)